MQKTNRHNKIILLVVMACAFAIHTCTAPNGPAKEGYTAKEAEQLASTRALEIWGNPILAMIETPDDGGGINRNGRLTKGIEGKWAFGYFQPGVAQGMIIEVQGTKTHEYSGSLAYIGGLQEILPNYLDSPEAIAIAEQNGGKKLTDVDQILCRLVGEKTWPKQNPREVAWAITYYLKNGGKRTFYIEAYTGRYLGKE